MKRSRFLKYASILMMLTALLRFFMGLGMFNIFATAKTLGTVGDGDVRIAAAAFGLICLCAVAELICGFAGALNWEEPLRVKLCVAWGAAALALGLAGNLVQGISGYGVSYVAWTTGLLVPLLYLIAALRFRMKSRG